MSKGHWNRGVTSAPLPFFFCYVCDYCILRDPQKKKKNSNVRDRMPVVRVQLHRRDHIADVRSTFILDVPGLARLWRDNWPHGVVGNSRIRGRRVRRRRVARSPSSFRARRVLCRSPARGLGLPARLGPVRVVGHDAMSTMDTQWRRGS